MGHEFPSVCHGITRRLLLLSGMMFSLILIFQYLELPNDNVFSSLFSAAKVPVAENATGPFAKSGMVSDVTHSNGLISSDTSQIHEFANNNTVTTEAEEIDPNYDFVSENDDRGDDPAEVSETEKLDWVNKNSTLQIVQNADNGPVPVEARNSEHGFAQKNETVGGNFSNYINEKENNTLASGYNESSGGGVPFPFPIPQPMEFFPNETLPKKSSETPVGLVYSNTSSKDKDTASIFHKNENSGQLQSDFSKLNKNHSATFVPMEDKEPDITTSAVISIAEMNDLLHKSHGSYRSMVCIMLHRSVM